MTTRGAGGITIGLTPLCRALKPRTKVPCMRIDPNHNGDHTNPYRDGGVTWPRTDEAKR